MSKIRNPEACCGNCVYWQFMDHRHEYAEGDGACSRYAPARGCPTTHKTEFCGEHPEFWREEVEREEGDRPLPVDAGDIQREKCAHVVRAGNRGTRKCLKCGELV